MSVVHRVTGYDRRTELLKYEFDVPDERLEEIRALARVPAAQIMTYGVFPLDERTAWAIAWQFQLPMNVDFYDWFFEPVAV